MGTTPAQPVEDSDLQGAGAQIDGVLLEELFREAGADSLGLKREEFARILLKVGARGNFGAGEAEKPGREQRAKYLFGLKLRDLALAHACAAGSERAWDRFIALYRQPLERAAGAITGSATLGREIADQLYGELFGLTERGGERRCPLESYCGRGSLLGWLRTIVAQRHVDHYRRHRHEEPLEEFDAASVEPEEWQPARQLTQLEKAVELAIVGCDADERLMLAAYYLDGRTLLGIAGVMGVHEATVSRKLKRLCEELRKTILRNLLAMGMSRREADEALGADPRDLDVNVKKLLQYSQLKPFGEKTEQ